MSLRVGIIGLGGIGNRHADCYRAQADAKLVAICDLDSARSERAQKRLGVPAYGSVEAMLGETELDAISVCTAGEDNGGHHYEPTMQAFEAGLDVLCEKPISNDITKAREMVAAAREKGLRFGINLNHRCVPAAEKARAWMDEGRIGRPLFGNMVLWIRNGNDTSPYFHLRALHPHSLDVMRYFLGDATHVQAFLSRGGEHKVNFSNVSLNLRFASGAIGHLTGSYDMTTRHPMERCEVAGTTGRFVIENVFEELTFYPHEGDEKTVVSNSIFGGLGSFGDTFTRRIGNWVKQLVAGDGPEQITASGADGLAAQEIIEAAIRSHERGTVEEVPSP